MDAFCHISCVAVLDSKHQFPNVRSSYIVNELVTERREDISSQAPQDAISVTRRLAI